MLESLLQKFHNNRSNQYEETRPAGPSDFILYRNGEIVRLDKNQSYELSPTIVPNEDGNSLTSLSIEPSFDYITLRLGWSKGQRHNANWGTFAMQVGGEKKFDVSIAESAYKQRGEVSYISGSNLRFNVDQTHLLDQAWSIQYAPQTS